ncbi:putative permease [Desulfovibrionales bacterium]
MDGIRARPTGYEIAAWMLTGLVLLLVFPLHLFSALMAGLLVYELVHMVAPLLRITRIGHHGAKLVVVGLLTFMIVSGLAFLAWKAMFFFHSDVVNLSTLLRKMAEIMEDVRVKLPAWVAGILPNNVEETNREVAAWLRRHAAAMQEAGKGIGLTLAHVLIGLVLGAIVSLTTKSEVCNYRPLTAVLAERVRRVSNAFRAVVFAQVRISALNTFLTFIYLAVILPAAGVHLPLVKTMMVITFFVGLLPVVGNLVSNSVIIIVSLSFSFSVAVASLVFLVSVHKLEYFLNARIVGGYIHARTWELLLAMLFMESAFGIAGVMAAPIYYAYIKKELIDQGVV